jgi:hypothetical protein
MRTVAAVQILGGYESCHPMRAGRGQCELVLDADCVPLSFAGRLIVLRGDLKKRLRAAQCA